MPRERIRCPVVRPGSRVETAGGVFRVGEDEPEARVGAGPHKTPGGRRDRFGGRDERSPLDRYDLGMDARGRPKCAFSGWYYRERLL